MKHKTSVFIFMFSGQILKTVTAVQNTLTHIVLALVLLRCVLVAGIKDTFLHRWDSFLICTWLQRLTPLLLLATDRTSPSNRKHARSAITFPKETSAHARQPTAVSAPKLHEDVYLLAVDNCKNFCEMHFLIFPDESL